MTKALEDKGAGMAAAAEIIREEAAETEKPPVFPFDYLYPFTLPFAIWDVYVSAYLVAFH